MSENTSKSTPLSLHLILWCKWDRAIQKSQSVELEIFNQWKNTLAYLLFYRNISLSKWAPIIYGRTYSVDFRFLVTPGNFDEKHKDLFWDYIKVTTRSAENLPGKPRWIFLRTNKRYLVGVTCMVRDLIASHTSQDSEDLTRDKLGRPLYTFVGYVSEEPASLVIPAMNLELFADPYLKFVSQKWQEAYTDLGSKQEVPQDLKSNYYQTFSPDVCVMPDQEPNLIPTNQLIPTKENSIIFWNISNAKNIWLAASEADKPLSICFGNLTKRDLLDSKFMNAVLDEIEHRQEEKKIRKVDIQPSSQPNTRKTSRQHSSARSSSQMGERDIHPQREEYRSHFGVNIAANVLVMPSKMARNFIEFFGGDGAARQMDDVMLNTFGEAARPILGDEIVDEMYVKIAKIDEWEKRLKLTRKVVLETLEQLKNECDQLEREIQSLKRQGREVEAQPKLDQITKTRWQMDRAKEKLQEVKQLLGNIQELRSRRGVHQTQSRQTGKKFQADPSLGFKEKVENEQLNDQTPPKKSSSSKDPWDL